MEVLLTDFWGRQKGHFGHFGVSDHQTLGSPKSDRSHVVLWANQLIYDIVFLRPLGLRLLQNARNVPFGDLKSPLAKLPFPPYPLIYLYLSKGHERDFWITSKFQNPSKSEVSKMLLNQYFWLLKLCFRPSSDFKNWGNTKWVF